MFSSSKAERAIEKIEFWFGMSLQLFCQMKLSYYLLVW